MKSLILLIVLSILGKVTGLFRELSIGIIYGIGDVFDMYILSMMLPSIILDVMSSGINSCYIPMHQKYYKKKPNVLIAIGGVTLFISFVLSVMIYLLNFEIIILLNSNLTDIKIDYLYLYSIPVSIYMFFYIVSEFYKSILICNGKVSYIPIVTSISNIMFISVLYLLYINSINSAIALSYCIFALIQIFLNYYISKVKIIKLIKSNGFSYGDLKYFISNYMVLFLPVAIGSISNQLNKAVDKTIVSNLENGSLSQLYFSQQLYAVMVGVFAVNVSLYYYPKICNFINNRDNVLLNSTINQSMYILSYISIALLIVIIIYGEALVDLTLGYGKLTAEDISVITLFFSIYASGLIFESISAISKRILWASGDTRTPMKIMLICVGINVILSVYLSTKIGVYGVIIATVITNLVAMILLMIKVSKMEGVNYNFIYLISRDVFMFFPLITISVLFFESVFIESQVVDIIMTIVFIMIVSVKLYYKRNEIENL
ncbi:lipid II flippase MurJ [Moritella sp. Urea-trap-13]|uniref:lipid II flippase MurJ n=1 Tax=Moritella sp. Urea-trap-13 TaxID=2058327 RepID=UPI000C32AF5E|nr:lipid II flippase MurJ [Moritella sp. Urea-trap-13]PKH05326.1 hypothetical protein CXF93_18745 [Moritella sp. Urea-trap-13]